MSIEDVQPIYIKLAERLRQLFDQIKSADSMTAFIVIGYVVAIVALTYFVERFF